MRVCVLLLFAAIAAGWSQDVRPPLASFSGTVHEIKATTLTLSRQDQDDLEISLTHGTHYYNGEQRIGRSRIKPGDRVSVETKLDLYLKPEAVNVRVLPPEKQ